MDEWIFRHKIIQSFLSQLDWQSKWIFRNNDLLQIRVFLLWSVWIAFLDDLLPNKIFDWLESASFEHCGLMPYFSFGIHILFHCWNLDLTSWTFFEYKMLIFYGYLIPIRFVLWYQIIGIDDQRRIREEKKRERRSEEKRYLGVKTEKRGWEREERRYKWKFRFIISQWNYNAVVVAFYY